MGRPQADDEVTITKTTEPPLEGTSTPSTPEQTFEKLNSSTAGGGPDEVKAKLQVEVPASDDQHMDRGEQNVLSVTIVDGNIDLKFNKIDIPALVDTGATVSCMRESLATTLSKQVTSEYVRIRSRVYLADGSMCNISRAIKIKFKIQNHTFSHQFSILPKLTQPIVLGTDFLSKTKSTIKYSVDPTPKSQPIRATKSVTIQPFSERAITGQVTCMHSVDQVNGVTDNLDRDNFSQYLVQRSVVTPNDRNRHPIILLNLTSRRCKIRKGEIIGVYTKTELNKATRSIVTHYDDLPLTDDQMTTDDGYSDTDSVDTVYITPAQSMCSDTDSDDPMSDDDTNVDLLRGDLEQEHINIMTEERKEEEKS